MIEININGQRKTLSQPLSIRELICYVGLDPRKVAVEVNREVVPNMQHPSVVCKPGDAVEIVTLVGGGGEHPPHRTSRSRSASSRSNPGSSPAPANTPATTSCAIAWPPAAAK